MQASTHHHFIGWSIGEILAAYQAKTLSPMDVAQICIARMRTCEPHHFAWEVFDEQVLLRYVERIQARLDAGQALRLLEGIPIGIKDIFNTIEFPTQMGSPIWQGFTPGNDARAVYHVLRQGAMLAGKTVTAEFAVHALGKTHNPHDATRNPGTSSSGSAVAVASGVLPVALGTQTAGSIVRPASYCGVYGCKPSFGLIPRTGMLKTTDSLDSVGFFVGCAADLERVWQSLRVAGRDYPLAERVFADPLRSTKPQNRPWKIALVRSHTWQYAEDYAKQALLDWASKLGGDASYQIEEVELPASLSRAHQVHGVIYDRTLHYYFQEEQKRSEFVSPVMNQILARGKEIPNAVFHQALAEQEALAAEMDQFFSQYDALISLSTAGQAPLRDEDEKPDPALIWTLTHLPVVAAPVFVSPEGKPFGMQLAARRYNDLQLFRLIDDLCAAGYLPQHQHPVLA